MYEIMDNVAKTDDDPGFAERLPSTSEMKLIRGAIKQLGHVKVFGRAWEGEKYPTINLVISHVL